MHYSWVEMYKNEGGWNKSFEMDVTANKAITCLLSNVYINYGLLLSPSISTY